MAVWGDWHVDAFLEVNLPTLLAPSNIPDFVKTLPTKFHVYTTARDQVRLARNPLFRKFADTVNIAFVELKGSDISKPIATHNWIWDQGREEALKTNSMAMVMPPDVAWSDGSMGHMAKLVEQGKSAIFLNWHLRAVSDTFIPQFLDLYHEANQPVSISGRDLVSLTIENIHPLCGAYLRDSRCFPYHSEMMFWPVPGQGLQMHVFALIPFLFDPAEFQLNENKTIIDMGDVSRLHCVADSDDVFMTSLAPIGKDDLWYQRNRTFDPVLFAKWWTYYDSPTNDYLAKEPFRLHFAAIDGDDWHRVEMHARQLIRRIMTTRDLFRIYLAAEGLECRYAAQLISAAIHLGLAPLLARDLVPMTVFLPHDAAFGERWDAMADALLHTSNKSGFLEFLKAHFIPTAKLVDEKSVAAERFRKLNGVGEPAQAGSHSVQVVRKVLGKVPKHTSRVTRARKS